MHPEPADSAMSTIRSGSPPNAATLTRSHSHRGAEIAQSEVRRHPGGREPPQRTEPVVQPDHHDVVRGEVRTVVGGERRRADPVAAARHPDEHRTRSRRAPACRSPR